MPRRPSKLPPGRASETPRRPPSADLSRKYAALCEKYRALVAKYEAEVAGGASVTMLALAAMRAGATALAAVRGGRCLVRNRRWLQLASERRAAWRVVDAGDGHQPPHEQQEDARSLEVHAVARADELVATGRTSSTRRLERADGTTVELRLERSRVEPPLVLAMITDVTEAVERERELARMKDSMEAQERLRAIGELASGMAHDLNNTLHALQLRLSRLGPCVAASPEHTEDLRVVERIAADAGARVRRLQDLARRREDLPDERVDLRAVISDAVELARPHDPDPALRLAFEVDLPPLPPVLGNAAELGHVFVNLFLNGKDAMPRGGRIAVTGTVCADGAVEITVADEGTGIPSENLERIFDPFFTTKGRRGTGLGLSMAAGVLRRLGGDIRAQNRDGGGAAFTLRFPAAPDLPARPRAPRDAPAESVPLRVLVVDDDPDNLDAMQLVLAQQGHHVEVTDSGVDAVARVEAGERYDAVLCDLGLGDTTGWEVAARIGAVAPGTRVVLVTGWAEEIPRQDPRRRHVARVLAKPVAVDDLREVLSPPDASADGERDRGRAQREGDRAQAEPPPP
jgi:signal transduction histidine kinase/ActR/RegA family two-component response regulator